MSGRMKKGWKTYNNQFGHKLYRIELPIVKAGYNGSRPSDVVSQPDNRVPVERDTNCLRLQKDDRGRCFISRYRGL
jgi:hypothetical protein